jgi:hypothetical protein
VAITPDGPWVLTAEDGGVSRLGQHPGAERTVYTRLPKEG